MKEIMEIYKLRLLSKNNIKTGQYLYQPWVRLNGTIYFCSSIISKKPLKKTDINLSELEVIRPVLLQH